MTPLLYGPDNRPLASSHSVNSNASYGVRRTAGGYGGTLSNWVTSRMSRDTEPFERGTVATRAQDLVANDPHASNIVDSMGVGIVGTGLRPQSRPNNKVLGWDEDQVTEFQEQAEWAFSIWEKEADAAGRLPFWAIQFLSVQSLVVNGEFFRIPVMLDGPDRTFSLALQCVNPLRMYTPSDLTGDTRIRDGVTLGKFGRPESFWIANPDDAYTSYCLPSGSFAKVPAKIGHRPGAFHVFIQKEEEQVRGISLLAPGMKFFRDLSDYLDFELVGAIVAASFPVFIETNNANDVVRDLSGNHIKPADLRYHQDVAAGTVIYGNPNEKPHVLESNRPGNTFPEFVERILRGIGVTVGMPYEVVAKDFSKTNYSSARAALLEAWRIFGFYQKWLVDSFCQKVWEMVLEEAWLRGMITLPAGSPDWYDARHAYTRASWIPPKKGNVDPLKEARANEINLKNNTTTLADIASESGQDVDALLEQRAREVRKQEALGRSPVATTPDEAKETDDLIAETELEENQQGGGNA